MEGARSWNVLLVGLASVRTFKLHVVSTARDAFTGLGNALHILGLGLACAREAHLFIEIVC